MGARIPRGAERRPIVELKEHMRRKAERIARVTGRRTFVLNICGPIYTAGLEAGERPPLPGGGARAGPARVWRDGRFGLRVPGKGRASCPKTDSRGVRPHGKATLESIAPQHSDIRARR